MASASRNLLAVPADFSVVLGSQPRAATKMKELPSASSQRRKDGSGCSINQPAVPLRNRARAPARDRIRRNHKQSITITSTSRSKRSHDMNRRLPAIVLTITALDLRRRVSNAELLAQRLADAVQKHIASRRQRGVARAVRHWT